MREKLFGAMDKKWHQAFKAGVFTEFMEQRAPGHTTLDGKIYKMGLNDFKARIAEEISHLDFMLKII